MFKNGLSGILYRRIIAAGMHSFKGLKDAIQKEEAFRVQIVLSFFLVPAAFVVAADYIQLLLLILSLFIVLIVELLNTGIEIVVDRIGSEFHELSGRAKDIGSAAVFLSMLAFIIVWGTIIVFNYKLF